MKPQASVVVPTYRRPELLTRCLSALILQNFPPGEFEIIVADDAASPETRAQVLDLSTRIQVRLRYVAVGPAHGPAAARNQGWRAAEAPIIAFTDDDCVPDPDWLRLGCKALIRSGASAATGTLVMPLPPTPTDYERDASHLSRAEFITANCFCLREALVLTGGFDERFTMAWREDSDLQFTLLKNHHSIIRAPDARVIHPIRPAGWGVSIQQQRKAIFNALLYKKHPDLYRQRIQPRTPWHYYAICTAILLILAGILTGHPNLAWTGIAAWLILTAGFCMKRLRGTARTPSHIAEMIITSAMIPALSIYWRLRGAWKYRVPFL